MDLRRLRPSAFALRTTELAAREVWPFISDPMLLPGFSTELQAVRIDSDAPIELGSTFEGDQLRGERKWTTRSTVTGFEPFHLFEWTVGPLDDPVSVWTFVLDESAGVTTLTQKVTLCGGSSPLSTFIEENPDSAEEAVRDRLQALHDRMAVTIRGLLDLAMAASRTQ